MKTLFIRLYSENPYPANILLPWKWCPLITSAAYNQNALQTTFIMDANTLVRLLSYLLPYQTSPKGAVWSSSILLGNQSTLAD